MWLSGISSLLGWNRLWVLIPGSVRYIIPCSYSLQLLESLRGSLGTPWLDPKIVLKVTPLVQSWPRSAFGRWLYQVSNVCWQHSRSTRIILWNETFVNKPANLDQTSGQQLLAEPSAVESYQEEEGAWILDDRGEWRGGGWRGAVQWAIICGAQSTPSPWGPVIREAGADIELILDQSPAPMSENDIQTEFITPHMPGSQSSEVPQFHLDSKTKMFWIYDGRMSTNRDSRKTVWSQKWWTRYKLYDKDDANGSKVKMMRE